MASVHKDGNCYRIAWRDGNKRRKRIRVAGVSKRQAESIAGRLQSIVGARIAGEALDSSTAAWLAEIGDDLRSKLAAQGLVEARDRTPLAEFIDSFITEQRSDVSPRTVLNWENTRNKLAEHFGGGCVIQDVTDCEAEDFQRWLVKQKTSDGRPFAKATVFWSHQTRKAILQRSD